MTSMSTDHSAVLLFGSGLEGRALGVARRGLEHHRHAHDTFPDLPPRGRVPGVEAAHEAHLEEDAGARDLLLDGRRLREGEGGRLLAERRSARWSDAMAMGRWVWVGLTITTASTSRSASRASGSGYHFGNISTRVHPLAMSERSRNTIADTVGRDQ